MAYPRKAAAEAVRKRFERTCFGRGSGGRPVFDAFDEGHGHLVQAIRRHWSVENGLH